MTILSTLPRLLNGPDLILLVILAVQLILGASRGCLRTLCGLVFKLTALALAVYTARLLAPTLARITVTPIVGHLFQSRAEQAQLTGDLLEGLRQSVTEAAVSMAESVAFLALLVLFFILFSMLAQAALRLLKSISDRTPLGLLDALGGAALGLICGVALIAVVLVGIEWFYPITYTPLGALPPDRVEQTVLLRFFIDRLPVAI